jgi:hypothetical protein
VTARLCTRLGYDVLPQQLKATAMPRSRTPNPKRRRVRKAIAHSLAAALHASDETESTQENEGPTTAMLAPVQALVAFMASLPRAGHPAIFVRRGLTIIENFPPYVFAGRDAAVRWERGFRRHALAGALTNLTAEFGPAQDFSADRSRAFFVLPTIWTGHASGAPFRERGAWSFVLLRLEPGWRILGYGWGVTSREQRSR